MTWEPTKEYFFAFSNFKMFSNSFRISEFLKDRGLTGGFLSLRNFSVAISVSPHVCFILLFILIPMFSKIMHL